MTTITAERPLTEPGPGTVAVDSAAPCAWAPCGRPLDAHGTDARPFHVDGFPVGSAECADRLYRSRRPMSTSVRPCCGLLPVECDCPDADLYASARRLFAGADPARPPIFLPTGGAR